MDPVSHSLSTLDEDADDLTANNVPDLLANEQTWPTEEEMMGLEGSTASQPGEAAKTFKRVPKGTSAYQAAWIIDEAGSEEEAESNSEQQSQSDGELDMDGAPRTRGNATGKPTSRSLVHREDSAHC